VNNAGVMAPLGPLVERSEDDWHYVFDVNAFGPARGVRAFLPQLRANSPDAQIVVTASLGGMVTVPETPVGVYVASKYAAVGYTESLRHELAPEGIGVSLLLPGMTRSNLMATSARNRPERFGGPQAPPAPPPPIPAIEAMTLEPEAIGPMLVRGIRENRLYIATHLEFLPLLEARHAAILADFDAEARARRPR
jgi:NAD(P)-dependent dehydrogenase (short-subunit alcohol dehydrogenase family)